MWFSKASFKQIANGYLRELSLHWAVGKTAENCRWAYGLTFLIAAFILAKGLFSVNAFLSKNELQISFSH
jgi:hypothetical protein